VTFGWKILVVVVVLVAGELAFFAALDQAAPWEKPGVHLVPILGFLFLAFLVAASHGAATFHRENEARTLEVLHSSPLTTMDLARAKVLATIGAAARPWWYLSLAHGLLAVFLGVHPIPAFVFYVMTSGVLLVSLVGFAMLMGLYSRTLARSVVKTMLCFVVYVLVLPVLTRGFLGMLRAGEDVAKALLSYHPLYVAAFPYAVAFDRQDVSMYAVPYAAIHFAFAFFVLGYLVFWRYEEKRAENWAL
jgi:hypothetical protein